MNSFPVNRIGVELSLLLVKIIESYVSRFPIRSWPNNTFVLPKCKSTSSNISGGFNDFMIQSVGLGQK